MRKVFWFDLDGTLVSSVNNIKNTIKNYLAKRGVTLTEEVWRVLIVIGYEKTAEYFIEHYNNPDSVEKIVNDLQKDLIKEYANEIFLKPNVKKYLEKIYNEGAEMYVLSASPHCFIDPCLKNNGVHEMFKQIISVDEYLPYDKSCPEFFEKVAEKLNVNLNGVIYFEDSIVAVETASKLGVKVYAVKDVQNEEDFKKITKIAYKTVYDYAELL